MPSLDEVLNNATNDEIEVDFSAAVNFAAVPEGDYTAVIESVESGRTKPTADNPEGNPKVVFRFKVVDEGPAKGRVFFRHAPTTGKGAGLTKEVLRAIGVPVDGDRIRFRLSQAVGAKLTLHVTLDESKDYPNEVKKVKAYTPPTASDLANLAYTAPVFQP